MKEDSSLGNCTIVDNDNSKAFEAVASMSGDVVMWVVESRTGEHSSTPKTPDASNENGTAENLERDRCSSNAITFRPEIAPS